MLIIKKVQKLPKGAKVLISNREEATKEKRFMDADTIRIELNDRFGIIIIEDTDHGTEWKTK